MDFEDIDRADLPWGPDRVFQSSPPIKAVTLKAQARRPGLGQCPMVA